MKRLMAAAAMCLAGLPALAGEHGLERVESSADVGTTMDRLAAAVTGAGATIFARVDHAEGAASVDMDLDPTQVLIFGNPKLGTQAMRDDPRAGLFLPMKVLVYEDDDGRTWLAYQDPADMLSGLSIPADAAYLDTMTGALGKLTAKAAGD